MLWYKVVSSARDMTLDHYSLVKLAAITTGGKMWCRQPRDITLDQ